MRIARGDTYTAALLPANSGLALFMFTRISLLLTDIIKFLNNFEITSTGDLLSMIKLIKFLNNVWIIPISDTAYKLSRDFYKKAGMERPNLSKKFRGTLTFTEASI